MSSVVDLNPVHTHIIRAEISNDSNGGGGEDGRVARRGLRGSESDGPSLSDSRDGGERGTKVRRVEQASVGRDPNVTADFGIHDDLRRRGRATKSRCHFERFTAVG